MLTGHAPFLVVPDVAAALDYYRDVLALFEEFTGRGADLLHAPCERPWGMLEIRVRDLNGYVLGIGQPLE